MADNSSPTETLWLALAQHFIKLVVPAGQFAVEVGAFFPQPKNPPADCAICYQATLQTTDNWEVVRQPIGRWANLCWDEVLTVFLQYGLRDLVAQEKQSALLHGALLEQAGKSCLFCAESGSGKSTLAFFLAQSGWYYLTDELVQFIPETHSVGGFLRPLVLKAGSASFYHDWQASQPEAGTHRVLRDGSIWISPACFRRATPPLTLRQVVFPRYQAGERLQVAALPGWEGAMRLVENSFNLSKLPPARLQEFLSYSANCSYYSVKYSNLQDVADWLADL